VTPFPHERRDLILASYARWATDEGKAKSSTAARLRIRMS